MTEPAVELREITKRFPGVLANDEVDLTVERGSVHALLGENGAGKTTLMNVLYGLYEPTSGTVVVDGEERSFESPRDAIDAGVGMIHQHFMLVDTMTVAENITLGNEPRRLGGLAVDRARARSEVADLAAKYGFDVDPEATVADLSVGVQQRVEILKALYRGAEVLILDEPTAVLTPQEVEDLFAVLDELTAGGKTVIFITHKLGEAMTAADRITVLRDGKNVGNVAAGETTRERLAELMVGREVLLLDVDRPPSDYGGVVLDVTDLTVTDSRGVRAVDDVSFEIRAGEIFGIAGVDGNGQTELAEAVTGLCVPDDGTVTLDGEDVTDWSRRERIDAGMSYVPADRQDEGLVMAFDLVENGLLGNQHSEPFATRTRIDGELARDHAESLIEEYDVRPPNADAGAESDVGSIEFIHERLLSLRARGASILLVSSKLEEVQALSDRLGVVHDGRFVDTVDPDAVTEEELGLLMAGERPERETADATPTPEGAGTGDDGRSSGGRGAGGVGSGDGETGGGGRE
ncbi:heme ABC transporter ATP-binding protein [Halobacteriales archaeon QH_10_67_22]|nr:MAG: heme ABC transporter ATP-binding protein [Halobacteriales archaeon QH_10_67_22]